MTTKRFAGTVVVAFIVTELLAIVVHGFILASAYAPFYGTLLRPKASQGDSRTLLLPLAHLCVAWALVWVYTRVTLSGSTVVRGTKLGLFGWIVGQAPLWMIWYAQQPWPSALVVKQLCLELASSLIIGITIAAVAGGVTRNRSAA